MPAKTRVPSHRLLRPTGLAFVTINGPDRYLGKHGTPESKSAYARLIAEQAAGVDHPRVFSWPRPNCAPAAR
jgi:hypothetical protein